MMFSGRFRNSAGFLHLQTGLRTVLPGVLCIFPFNAFCRTVVIGSRHHFHDNNPGRFVTSSPAYTQQVVISLQGAYLEIIENARDLCFFLSAPNAECLCRRICMYRFVCLFAQPPGFFRRWNTGWFDRDTVYPEKCRIHIKF